MEPPKIDLTNPIDVVAEIFNDDQWIKDEFSRHLSSEILQFGETLAESFKRFPRLDKLASGRSEQVAFAAGFVFGVFDDLLVSMKLLVAGKMIASGNLMRQAIEGLSVATLCASPELITVSKKNPVKVNYWELVKANDPRVYAHRSIEQLELNCDTLGISRDAIAKLSMAQKRYRLFSHPGLIGMASRMAMGARGPIYTGGNFDTSKLPAYKSEIAERTALCRILPKMIDELISRVATEEPGQLGLSL